MTPPTVSTIIVTLLDIFLLFGYILLPSTIDKIQRRSQKPHHDGIDIIVNPKDAEFE